MKRVILDVDTGSDDAVAIMLAALHPQLRLLGCTTVKGNLPVANTTDNTLRVLDHIGRSDIPVYRGLGRPFAPNPFSRGPADATPETFVHQVEIELPVQNARRNAEHPTGCGRPPETLAGDHRTLLLEHDLGERDVAVRPQQQPASRRLVSVQVHAGGRDPAQRRFGLEVKWCGLHDHCYC